MGLQAYYDNFATQPSRWSHSDSELCGCRGSGWFLSELDTWHECPIHHVEGQRHPEGDDDPETYAWHIVDRNGAVVDGADTFEAAAAELKRWGRGHKLTRNGG